MSFQNKNLSVIAYANGFTLWHYAATETVSSITATGYFNPVRTLMNVGDIVIINGSDNTAIRKINQTAANVTTGEAGDTLILRS
ncbi:MAG: hypothetical protein FWE50_01025, partial [Alphaproteobacteria bacterium]|nr:hypothetical protein [Alphaproteobacteria bacterium]